MRDRCLRLWHLPGYLIMNEEEERNYDEDWGVE